MAENKVQQLQQEILKLTDTIKKNGKATKEQAEELKKLEAKYAALAKKLMPQYRKAHEQVNKELKQAKSLTDSVSKSSDGYFKKLRKAIGTLSRYSIAYAGINAVLRLGRELFINSAKRAIELEKALADVAAVANLSASEIDRLEQVVFKVAGTTSLTAVEVVELQKQLAKLGTSVTDIENLTGPVALLSQALGEEPGGVAASLKKAINQFQVTSDEADRFANILVGAVNESALSLNDIGTALQYVGPLAAQSGLTFQETASLLGVLADNGFRASRAGTGLANILIKVSQDGRPLNEVLEDMAQRNLTVAEATELFTRRGAAAAITLANNIENISILNEELSNNTRLLTANAKQMSSTQGQLDLLSSAYNRASIRLGDYITKTEFFIELLEFLDPTVAGQARAFKVIAGASEETSLQLDNLAASMINFGGDAEENALNTTQLLLDVLESSGSIAEETLGYWREYAKDGGDLMATLSSMQMRGGLPEDAEDALLLAESLLDISAKRAKELRDLRILEDAQNENYKEATKLTEKLTAQAKEGLLTDKEKQRVTRGLEQELTQLQNQRERSQGLSVDEIIVLEKRIALFEELAETVENLENNQSAIDKRREKANKEADEKEKARLRSKLDEFLKRIKETEQAIQELPADVSDEAFGQQVDLLSGFFGSAEDIIAEATKRFGADSDFVKELIKTFKKTADKVSVELPPILEPKTLLGDLRDAFKGTSLAEIIGESLDKAAEVIESFNEVALENTRNRLEAEKSAIENRFQTESDILKSQLDNQLITESQFRAKQKEIQQKRVAEENAINKKIFEAEKRQDKQNATTDYLQALASIVPNLIISGKEGDPITISVKAAISAALTTASFAGELAAIGQRKFFPKKFAEGGVVNGPSHDQGGVPFSVQGRGGYEMEGGEYIINKRATAMHKDLLDRINASGMTRPKVGNLKFAQGGMVNTPLNESVDYLKAIAEATTSTAIGVSKPVRAYVSSKDLRQNETERRLRDRNDRI